MGVEGSLRTTAAETPTARIRSQMGGAHVSIIARAQLAARCLSRALFDRPEDERRGLKVLLVDDDEVVRLTLAAILENKMASM